MATALNQNFNIMSKENNLNHEVDKNGTICIYCSHGTFIVNAESGKVRSSTLDEHCLSEYSEIYQFDLQEARDNGLDSNDILNFGYWYYTGIEDNGVKETAYEPPCFDWREETKLAMKDEL